MKQADLFNRETFVGYFRRLGDAVVAEYTKIGASIAPPQPDEIARRAGERGIALSADHAERVSAGWQARAVGYVRLHATVHASFMCEDVREMAEADGFDLPPSKTAWGSVMRQAAREGIVAADGYAPANSSRRGPKSVWRSLVRAA